MELDDYKFFQLTERVKNLEDKLLRSTKKETTRAQQMLLLKHLGLLEIIDSLDLSKKKKAQILSFILNASAENIEDDLTNINAKNSPIATKKNYEFLIKCFSEIGLKEHRSRAEIILENIERKG